MILSLSNVLLLVTQLSFLMAESESLSESFHCDLLVVQLVEHLLPVGVQELILGLQRKVQSYWGRTGFFFS